MDKNTVTSIINVAYRPIVMVVLSMALLVLAIAVSGISSITITVR